jgi:hypothetical protein
MHGVAFMGTEPAVIRGRVTLAACDPGTSSIVVGAWAFIDGLTRSAG